jgi:hypothetical protein
MWANRMYGTTNPYQLRVTGAPANVVATAELLTNRPVRNEVVIYRPDDATLTVLVNGAEIIALTEAEHCTDGMAAVERTAERIAVALNVEIVRLRPTTDELGDDDDSGPEDR